MLWTLVQVLAHGKSVLALSSRLLKMPRGVAAGVI
jgi:hypothetical protein